MGAQFDIEGFIPSYEFNLKNVTISKMSKFAQKRHFSCTLTGTVISQMFSSFQKFLRALAARYRIFVDVLFHKNPPKSYLWPFFMLLDRFCIRSVCIFFCGFDKCRLVDFFDFLSISSICIRRNQFKIASFSWKEKRQQRLLTKSEKFSFSLSTKFFMRFW